MARTLSSKGRYGVFSSTWHKTVGTLSTAELVITAPQAVAGSLAYAARCRQTIGVLAELMVGARDRLVIAAPFFQPGAGLSVGVLNTALRSALKRGVRIDLVSTVESLLTIDVSGLRRVSTGRLRMFRPVMNVVDQRVLGSHAKFCVADGAAAYVGSANLTGPGMSGQVELGILVRGPLARQIEEFWHLCLQLGLFVPA